VNIEIYDKNNLQSLAWSQFKEGDAFKQFFEPLILQGTRPYIRNLDVDIALLTYGNHLIPIAFGKESAKNQAYVASNTGQYINYPINELGKLDVLKGVKKWLTISFLKILKSITSAGKFDHCIFVNAFMLSSNLWGRMEGLNAAELIQFLKNRYPDRSIIFKGITGEFHQQLYQDLLGNHCRAVFARELYFLDPKNSKYKKKRPFVIDRKLAEKLEGTIDWKYPYHLQEDEKENFLNYYKALYLDKYSDFNPDYRKEFLELVSQSEFFKIGSIKDTDRFLGAQVVFRRENFMTTPFIGYDRDEPKETGLYRLLNYYLTKETVDQECILNMSSGAGNFKKQRGGKPVLEFNMVYFSHLSAVRQLPWRVFEYIGRKIVIPNLSKLNI
jgi:hypothetical protein